MTSETARSHRVPTPAAMMPQNAVALAWARPGDAGVVYRAHRLWRVAGLTPIGVHECRHIFASLMIAAGVNIKALQVFMGEASITVTLDRYGHLLLGSETEAAALLDAYLTAARTGAR